MNELAARALFNAEIATLPRVAVLRNWTVHQSDYPVLDISFVADGRRTLRVRVLAPHWDEQPPSIELLTADGARLTHGQAPAYNIFHQGPHRNTGYPFICMAGTKEYHEHESHVGDSWENYRHRPGCGLVSIVGQVWNGWLRASP